MREDLLKAVQALRSHIRYHRDQKGDDRCWVDDDGLWALLSDTPTQPRTLPPFEEMMRRCGAFYRYRRSDVPDVSTAKAVVDPALWDKDLEAMTDAELESERLRLEAAVRVHRDIQGRERTLDDDRRLYQSLPEQLPADFRLPKEEDFLGEGRAPHAGCPSFWRSHQGCVGEQHDIHSWGPCL